MKKRISALLALFCFALPLVLSGGARAAPLNLVQTYPDFFVDFLSFSYDHTSGVITVDGDVGSYSAGPAPSPQLFVTNHPTDSSYKQHFSLTATIDSSGNVLSGSFLIDGVVRSDGWPSNNGCTFLTCIEYDGSTNAGGLLSSTLVEFGWTFFDTGSGFQSGLLEFRFVDAAGVIADLGYPSGGMKLNITSTLPNGTTDSEALAMSWTGSGNGDVFVPVPAAVWLFGSGLLALLGVVRRGKKIKEI